MIAVQYRTRSSCRDARRQGGGRPKPFLGACSKAYDLFIATTGYVVEAGAKSQRVLNEKRPISARVRAGGSWRCMRSGARLTLCLEAGGRLWSGEMDETIHRPWEQ